MAASAIGLHRLASQRISAGHLDDPAAVVRWLGAVQAQDYGQSLWAVGARLKGGTAAQVEASIAARQIARTWLMRGTIHFAPPEDVRRLIALVAPRLKVADARRCEQLGLTAATVARSGELLEAALSGDRRLTRPGVMALLESEGIATSGGHGYHILWRLALDGLICGGPLEGKQQTFVLLDDWAPREHSRDLSPEESLAVLARTFATARGPVTDHDLARWAGIALGDARAGLRDAGPALTRRAFGGVEHWLSAESADRDAPAAGRRKAFLLAGFDEYVLGYKDRDAVLAPEHAARVVPGANGVFRPIVVAGGRIVGTWARTVRPKELRITLQPFSSADRTLATSVAAEARRYRSFLALGSRPVAVTDGAE